MDDNSKQKPSNLPMAMAAVALTGNALVLAWLYLSETGSTGHAAVGQMWFDQQNLKSDLEIQGYKIERIQADLQTVATAAGRPLETVYWPRSAAQDAPPTVSVGAPLPREEEVEPPVAAAPVEMVGRSFARTSPAAPTRNNKRPAVAPRYPRGIPAGAPQAQPASAGAPQAQPAAMVAAQPAEKKSRSKLLMLLDGQAIIQTPDGKKQAVRVGDTLDGAKVLSFNQETGAVNTDAGAVRVGE